MTIPQPIQYVEIQSESSKAPAPSPEKPKLTLIPNVNNETEIDVFKALELYQHQNRECWLCKKIATSVQAGKETSDDEKWHFITCVMSWENLITRLR